MIHTKTHRPLSKTHQERLHALHAHYSLSHLREQLSVNQYAIARAKAGAALMAEVAATLEREIDDMWSQRSGAWLEHFAADAVTIVR